ncbi:MAG: ABC transporter substrate-binding protein [Pseudomonadota bacterium]
MSGLMRGAVGVALALLAMLPARAESVLRFVPHADLRILDPVWTTGYITRNHGYMVYDTLFALDAELKPQPQMVETWSVSADGLIYSFTLRPGLTFHDGSPVRPPIASPRCNAGASATPPARR